MLDERDNIGEDLEIKEEDCVGGQVYQLIALCRTDRVGQPKLSAISLPCSRDYMLSLSLCLEKKCYIFLYI